MIVKKNLRLIFIVLLSILAKGLCSVNQCPNIKNPLGSIRKRRHLTFPDGSTVSMTTSVVKTFMTHVPSGWFMSVEADVVYHLPDAKVILAHNRKKLHHRQKREFWETLQGALDSRNMNGKACVVRSICEAKTHLAPPGKSLVHDILRAVFTAPLHDEEFHKEIGIAYTELSDPDICSQINDCTFSFLDFVLELNKFKT
ncbi:uncharacterized protein LOC114244980 [Bombyx mandarina]|uniref:Uncharacterized protein LOC114244980 n=1 Tax=Bombyx mandarina TaxID=7092 RepID=A0A6J2JSJ2_BOMMA|nr:uncharacterized protein LOC114244980 [Bombyx mandarina]